MVDGKGAEIALSSKEAMKKKNIDNLYALKTYASCRKKIKKKEKRKKSLYLIFAPSSLREKKPALKPDSKIQS